MAVIFSDSLKAGVPGPLDGKYLYQDLNSKLYFPYASTSSACSSILSSVRSVGLTVLIGTSSTQPYPQEYWWQNGTSDSDLVLKQSGGNITGSASNGYVTLWTGTTSIGYDSNLKWDNSSIKLSIGSMSLSWDGTYSNISGPLKVPYLSNMTQSYNGISISNIHSLNSIAGISLYHQDDTDSSDIYSNVTIINSLQELSSSGCLYDGANMDHAVNVILPPWINGSFSVHFGALSGASQSGTHTYGESHNIPSYYFDTQIQYISFDLNNLINNYYVREFYINLSKIDGALFNNDPYYDNNDPIILKVSVSKNIHNVYYNTYNNEVFYSDDANNDENFANTDLTLTYDRHHRTNGYNLSIEGGFGTGSGYYSSMDFYDFYSILLSAATIDVYTDGRYTVRSSDIYEYATDFIIFGSHSVSIDSNQDIGIGNNSARSIYIGGVDAGNTVSIAGNHLIIDGLSNSIANSILYYNTNSVVSYGPIPNSSQWNDVTGGIYYNAGNVIIGAATNIYSGNALQVTGNAYVSGNISASGSITAQTGGFDSDFRLKSDIVYNPKIEGIDSIKSASYVIGGNSHIGYIAQDVEGIVPSSIIKKDDGYLALNYNEVLVAKVAYLENKVKELYDIIERNGLK